MSVRTKTIGSGEKSSTASAKVCFGIGVVALIRGAVIVSGGGIYQKSYQVNIIKTSDLYEIR